MKFIYIKKNACLACILCFMMCFFEKKAIAFEQSILPYFQNSNLTKKSFKTKNLSYDQIKSLHFLTSLDFPIFNYLTQEGYLMGYNVDLMRAICHELAIEDQCTVEAVPFKRLLSHLLSGKADVVIAGIKPFTSKDIAFTDPYLKFPSRFMTLKENAFQDHTIKKIASKTIGVVAHTYQEEALKKYFPNIKIRLFETQIEAYKALKQNEIYAFWGDGLSLSSFLNTQEGRRCCSFSGKAYNFDPFGMRIAYNKKNSYLASLLPYILKNLEQKGALKELYMKYFPIGFY